MSPPTNSAAGSGTVSGYMSVLPSAPAAGEMTIVFTSARGDGARRPKRLHVKANPPSNSGRSRAHEVVGVRCVDIALALGGRFVLGEGQRPAPPPPMPRCGRYIHPGGNCQGSLPQLAAGAR